jgi:predicted small secreted protein
VKAMMAILLVAALFLAGCNTMKGLGQDIENAGEAIQEAGSK